MGGLRESKKRETRQRISDVATALFYEHGFDAVTLAAIAAAANVSTMTVTNYFARKEELILDREDDLRLASFRQALRDRPKRQSPIDAIRAHVRALAEARSPLAHVDPRATRWWRVVLASPALRSRLHELADEATAGLAVELGGPEPDGRARLLAGLLVLTVRTAREEALRLLEGGASARRANAALLALIEAGLTAAEALDR